MAAERVSVVDFFHDDPDGRLVALVHEQGALACWQVGSREEAVAAVEAGCDFVIAQGNGAGGHVRGTIGLLPLLDEVLDAVQVPVLAAGGIGSGRALAAVLAAGADGARIGTRFVAAEEARAHPAYVDALIAARARDSVYTDTFDVGWVGEPAPHRVLRSSVEAVRRDGRDIIGGGIDLYSGEPFEVRRFGINAVRDTFTGSIEAMSLWAGESVGGVQRLQPAADIVRELVDEAEHRIRSVATATGT